jgi:ABC-type amino acid transport substrate-binding protein
MLTSGTILAAPASTLEQIKNTETIRIGYRENEPPMSFLNKDNQPVGYSIDLCLRIVSAVKSRLKNPNIATKYVPVTASNRFEMLTSNSIDSIHTQPRIIRGKGYRRSQRQEGCGGQRHHNNNQPEKGAEKS